MKKFFLLFFYSLLPLQFVLGQTIAEKKAGLTSYGSDLSPEMEKTLTQLNEEKSALQEELSILYSQAEKLWEEKALPSQFQALIKQIKELKNEIHLLDDSWRQSNAKLNQKEEQYALWHQPETTLGQLINDYGSENYVYIVSPEIAKTLISVNSNLPIPHTSWEEMLEIILNQNGVGVRQLNPYLKELYFIKESNAGIKLITNTRADLALFPDNVHVAFVLSPQPSEVKRIGFFLNKFINPKTTVFQVIGRDIILVAQIKQIKELLKIYDFISSHSTGRAYKVIPLRRVDAVEMAKVLDSVFAEFTEEPTQLVQKGTKGQQDQPKLEVIGKSQQENNLVVIPLETIANALFLIGTAEEIRQAELLIKEVQNQVGAAQEKVIYRYKVRNSEPEDLADVLAKTYSLMIAARIGLEEQPPGPEQDQQTIEIQTFPQQNIIPDPVTIASPPYTEPFFLQGQYTINPTPISPGTIQDRTPPNEGRTNFLVDVKTSSIIMVVEAYILPRLKELLKELDVPKRMVKLDVLLFERRLERNQNYGLNLLKLGDAATQTREAAVKWNVNNMGIFDFLFSKPKGSNFPAYDLLYRFLISQNDIHINSNPSVVAINQTEAKIAIQEEFSLSTGTYSEPSQGGVILKDSFTRVQYGITIVMRPTIHMHDEEEFFGDPNDYVSLDLHINFDTPQRGENREQPDVFRREVINQVRVTDGQSVIIGGLRGKDTNDLKRSIPFLGEIPGLGKLFSWTELTDQDRDMYIVITPHIVSDPEEDFNRLRRFDLCRRPGDVPSYLCKLDRARECEKNRLFHNWRRFLFGPQKERCTLPFDKSMSPEDPCPPHACSACQPCPMRRSRRFQETYHGK